MSTKYLVFSVFDDEWYKNESFDTQEDAMAVYHNLLDTRLDEITSIEVVRQDRRGFKFEQTTIIKAVL